MLLDGTNWIEAVRDVGVPDVAAALDYTVTRTGVAPCPACGAERRGAADPRGPVGLRRDGGGWRCHRCHVHGDAMAFLAHAVAGAPLDRDNWRAVRAAAAGAGLCTGPAAWGAKEAKEAGSLGFLRFDRASAASPVGEGRGFGRFFRASAPRPPHEEVLELWGRGLEVTDSADARAWFLSRGVDPAAVADFGLARALPAAGALPGWARSNAGSWRDSGHTVLVPLHGATGALESLRARSTRPGAAPAKSLAPLGTSVTGLVLADALTKLVLAGAPLGDVKSTPSATELARVGLVVVEGEVDWWTWATRWSDAAVDAPGVLGLVAGSWTDEVAARVPAGARVAVRVHADAAGDGYAAKVIDTLAHRCDVRRVGGTA